MMHFASLDGCQLAYVDRGQGPVILMVHGFPLDHSMWNGQIESLSQQCRVIAVDLRGFGQSKTDHFQWTIEQLADDCAALLQHLEIHSPITFCGLSMGGYVAWQFWQRHAQRLERFILCDTRALADTQQMARGRHLVAKQVERVGAGVVVDAMMPKLFAEASRRRIADEVESLRQVMSSTAPETIRAALLAMAARPDVTARLGEIQVPALVICGEHDVISPSHEMQQIAEAMPNADYVEIPGVGHMAPMEDPARVNDAMSDFMARSS